MRNRAYRRQTKKKYSGRDHFRNRCNFWSKLRQWEKQNFTNRSYVGGKYSRQWLIEKHQRRWETNG